MFQGLIYHVPTWLLAGLLIPGLLAAVVGAALLLILEVNYPFTGSVHISADAFEYARGVFDALPG